MVQEEVRHLCDEAIAVSLEVSWVLKLQLAPHCAQKPMAASAMRAGIWKQRRAKHALEGLAERLGCRGELRQLRR